MVTYDKAKWHYGGEGFSKGLPIENGGTHIGLFLAWMIRHEMIGPWLLQESKATIDAVRNGKMTGREFLFAELDGVLGDEALNDEGNSFTEIYYGGGLYFQDMTFPDWCETPYHAPDDEDMYHRTAAIIDKRFAEWKANGKLPPLQPSPGK